jgi:hypothetical protein
MSAATSRWWKAATLPANPRLLSGPALGEPAGLHWRPVVGQVLSLTNDGFQAAAGNFCLSVLSTP